MSVNQLFYNIRYVYPNMHSMALRRRIRRLITVESTSGLSPSLIELDTSKDWGKPTEIFPGFLRDVFHQFGLSIDRFR